MVLTPPRLQAVADMNHPWIISKTAMPGREGAQTRLGREDRSKSRTSAQPPESRGCPDTGGAAEMSPGPTDRSHPARQDPNGQPWIGKGRMSRAAREHRLVLAGVPPLPHEDTASIPHSTDPIQPRRDQAHGSTTRAASVPRQVGATVAHDTRVAIGGIRPGAVPGSRSPLKSVGSLAGTLVD